MSRCPQRGAVTRLAALDHVHGRQPQTFDNIRWELIKVELRRPRPTKGD